MAALEKFKVARFHQDLALTEDIKTYHTRLSTSVREGFYLEETQRAVQLMVEEDIFFYLSNA